MSPQTSTIVRKTQTGEPGNGGEFGTHVRDADDVTLVDAAIADIEAGESAEESIFRKRYDTPEDKVKAFMAELETQVGDLDNDENWQNYLTTMAKFHHYSMNNQILIAIQHPGATKVAGFKKWQELGRQVRKGERGISIMAPRKANIELKDAAGNPIRDENGKPRKALQVVGITTATVFDISQTDGPDLPSGRQELSEEPPAGLIDDLTTAISDTGFTVSYDDIRDGSSGFTTTDGSKRIVVKTGLTPGSVARVLAHELGHVKCGHVERAAEYHRGHGGDRGHMEVEADSFSYAVLRSNGMSPEVGQANASYIHGWSDRDATSVKTAAVTVSKAVKSVFEDSKWQNVE
jgi:antirestriction protein ArdC